MKQHGKLFLIVFSIKKDVFSL